MKINDMLLQSDVCYIDNHCYYVGDRNPDNHMEVCLSTNSSSWSSGLGNSKSSVNTRLFTFIKIYSSEIFVNSTQIFCFTCLVIQWVFCIFILYAFCNI